MNDINRTVPDNPIQAEESVETLRKQVKYYKEQAEWWKKDYDAQKALSNSLVDQIKTWKKVLDIIDRSMKHDSHGY